MPLALGRAVPTVVLDALNRAGIAQPCVVGVVKEGCPACEDALPVLDAAAALATPGEHAVLIFAQEDPAATSALRAAFAPTLPFAADDAPYPVSRALQVDFTPTLFRVDSGRVTACVEAFDPDGLSELLKGLSVARGHPAFELFKPGDPRPRYRPG